MDINSSIDKLYDLSTLLEKGHISNAEFIKFKSEIFQNLNKIEQVNIKKPNATTNSENTSRKESQTTKVEIKPETQETEPLALLTLATALIGFWFFPIIFAPVSFVAGFISYYRIKENPKYKGQGIRLAGAIINTLNILWIMYSFGYFGA